MFARWAITCVPALTLMSWAVCGGQLRPRLRLPFSSPQLKGWQARLSGTSGLLGQPLCPGCSTRVVSARWILARALTKSHPPCRNTFSTQGGAGGPPAVPFAEVAESWQVVVERGSNTRQLVALWPLPCKVLGARLNDWVIASSAEQN